MPQRYSITAATVLMLVVLRLNIGWHFFSEGVKHYTDPHWTSEPVLRAAKGPLAPMFHSFLTDFHGFDRLLHGAPTQSEEHAAQDWIDEIQKDWDQYRQRFIRYYDLTEAQQDFSARILQLNQDKLRAWAAANKEALAAHVHQWQRKETTREAPDGDLPFQRKRTGEKQVTLSGEAAGWQAEVKLIERAYQDGLASLLDSDQRGQPAFADPAPKIHAVDTTMTYVILGVGLLLLLGLFTRVACVVGAVFLFSVVMTQPFWVSETQPTFNQFVEMFALLTLATTQVGRWCGLDYFLADLIRGSCCSTKGKSDASHS